MSVSGCGLMTSPEYRPFEDTLDGELLLSEFQGEAPDFLDGPSDEFFPVLRFVFFGVMVFA